MKIVGRNTEQELLRECLFSGRPEFLAVYGRRRVGKTFLIKEYFENSFSFYATGVPNQKTAQQLKYFHQSLQQYGCPEKRLPETGWRHFPGSGSCWRGMMHRKIR